MAKKFNLAKRAQIISHFRKEFGFPKDVAVKAFNNFRVSYLEENWEIIDNYVWKTSIIHLFMFATTPEGSKFWLTWKNKAEQHKQEMEILKGCL